MLAVINIRVDLLETERAHRRISQEAYLTGRVLQRAWEMASRLGPSSAFKESDRVDAALAHEVNIVKGLENARAIDALRRRVITAIGHVGMRMLEQILRDGHTFATYAAGHGLRGERGVTAVGDRFRWQLEALAKEPSLAE